MALKAMPLPTEQPISWMLAMTCIKPPARARGCFQKVGTPDRRVPVFCPVLSAIYTCHRPWRPVAFDKCEAAGGSAGGLFAVPVVAVEAGAGTALGCGYLGWGHDVRQPRRGIQRLVRCPLVPARFHHNMRHHISLRHTFTVVVHDLPSAALGFSIPPYPLPSATTSLLRDHPAAHRSPLRRTCTPRLILGIEHAPDPAAFRYHFTAAA